MADLLVQSPTLLVVPFRRLWVALPVCNLAQELQALRQAGLVAEVPAVGTGFLRQGARAGQITGVQKRLSFGRQKEGQAPPITQAAENIQALVRCFPGDVTFAQPAGCLA